MLQQKVLIGLAAMLAQFALVAGVSADWTEHIGVGVPVPIEKPEEQAKQSLDTVPSVVTPRLASRRKACPAVISGAVTATYLPPVQTETLCGAEAPLEVTSILNIPLKPAAQLNCEMASALVDWIGYANATAGS